MKLTINPPVKSLNKAYLKQSIKRDQIELFKINLARMFERICSDEHEEHLKNIVSDFLKDTWYKQTNEINTSGRADLAIHNGTTSTTSVGVLIEVKRPTNKSEMISPERPNAKALHELLHYYMQERYIKGNNEIRHLIICNIYEWYIFDAADFEHFFFGNQKLVKSYKDWNEGLLVGTNTDWFYQEIAKTFIEKELDELRCTYFDLKDYERIIRNPAQREDSKLICLYKVLSPSHLLKQTFTNDSNSLNKEFYSELLHILGLEEAKEKGKKLIRRKQEGSRNDGSLLENTCNFLKTRGRLSVLSNLQQYGADEDEQCFSVALELCITWLNRLLFLKLLEGQLIGYNKGDRSYAFLNNSRIGDFDELNELFFEVLAVRVDERSESVRTKFGSIPYLNSSLFEESDLERATMRINELKNRLDLPLHGATVLKGGNGKRLSGSKSTLAYLFEFLDAYDFGAEGSPDIQEQNKSIINASVLGLIFEKINGYKDGSFFTPGFITMYICRETIRRAVVSRFNEAYGWNCTNLTELYNDLYRQRVPLHEANTLVNSLKICDPAVGSGHFLVSALNEIIAIKSELKILADSDSKLLRCDVTVENDELIVTVDDLIFEYHYKDAESQRLQETFFHEKETIIENCLFGVDINPKSVAICRLRLWIELLKNAYYRRGSDQLETLPNIDINIKCGNSLVSRFAISGNPNIPAANRRKLKELTDKYRGLVWNYKQSPSNKGVLRKEIENLKHSLENFGLPNDKDLKSLWLKKEELSVMALFGFSKEEAEKRQKLHVQLTALEQRFAEKEKLVYHNAFEWRFEFPEVLDDAGEFVGFDAIIGNPPYIRQEAIKDQKPAFMEMFGTFYCGTADIYTYFYKAGLNLLKTGATLCYIAPNKFMRAGYGKNTRELLTTQATPLMVLDFGDLPIFDEATTYPSIVMVEKNPPSQPPPAGGRSKKASLIQHGNGEKVSLHQRGRVGEGESLQDQPGIKVFIPTPVPLPLLVAARALRGDLTDAEQLLWHCLRRKQLDGYRFRRQHPFERFVLDFYCCEVKLAVELDGGQHNEPVTHAKDNERTAFLEQQGIQVIRFWNNEVFSNIEGVLETIYQTLQRKCPHPNPPPLGEGADPKTHSNEAISPSPQRGEAGRGEVFFTATFTTYDQLSRFDKTLATIGFTMPVAALRGDGWTLERPEVMALMDKLRTTGKPLGEYVEGKFYYGIKTGLNEAFVIDEETKGRLIAEDPKSAELIKPWLRGRDIKKWQAEWAGLYIIAIASSGNKEWPWSQETSEATARPLFEQAYPAVLKHLSQWETGLRKRDDKGRFWWELRACAYWDEFEKTKLVYQEIATFQSFAYAETGLVCNNKCFLIPKKNDFFLALLNSKLFWWYLGNLTSGLVGGARAMQMPYMNQLPIPSATAAQQTPIIELVQKILAMKIPLPSPPPPGEGTKLIHPAGGGWEGSDVSALEAEIDRLVYDLYSLTDEEIAVVEGSAIGKNHN